MELFSFVEAREDMKLSDLQKQLETKRGMKRMNERREERGERREERGERREEELHDDEDPDRAAVVPFPGCARPVPTATSATTTDATTTARARSGP